MPDRQAAGKQITPLTALAEAVASPCWLQSANDHRRDETPIG